MNAKDDPKCMLLIDDLGMEGYGIFWVLIEILRSQPDYRCPINMIKSIARQYNTTAPKVEVVIKNYGLFVLENETFFYSESLLRRMQILDNKRLKLSEAGKKGNAIRHANNSISSPPDSHPIATQSQVNKSKVKEIKEKESKENKKRDFLEKQFEEIFFKWIEYKKERKESYKSLKSEEVFYNKLLELANYSPFEAEQIINQSIANNWAGIFPIKNNNLKNLNNATTTSNPNDRRSGVERLNKLAGEFLQNNPNLFTLRNPES